MPSFDRLTSQGFDEDTPVVLANGKFRRIASVEIGDEVLSRNESTGETAAKRVTKVFKHECGASGVIGISFFPDLEFCAKNPRYMHSWLYSTAEHPFWVIDKGWTPAGALQPGDKFLLAGGQTAVVGRLSPKEWREFVYYIEVEDFQTYFVDIVGIWVHNKTTGVTTKPRLDRK
jgi:hypothetical protein